MSRMAPSPVPCWICDHGVVPGHVVAMGGGGFLGGDRDSPLDALLLELAPSSRPRLALLATATGDSPRAIEAFHHTFAQRGSKLDAVELFGVPDRPAERVASADAVLRGGGVRRDDAHRGRLRPGNRAWVPRHRRRVGAARDAAAAVNRVAVVASASGNGKTTFSRALAEILGVPCHELDALNHRAGWVEATPAELRAVVAPLVAGGEWVIDGTYRGKLGSLVLDAADTVVWLDLPILVWLPRLLWRTFHRIVTQQELWNGNRESLRSAFWGRDALVPFALRSHVRRRRTYPTILAPYPVVRLRIPDEVDAFLTKASRPPD
jgi:hypothetical protein